MKIKSVKPLKNGMSESAADSLFDKIAAFAGYGFNRSHAIEYSIVSYWTMWLRVRYPAEYFAACLSIVGDDKLEGLVKDAREYGIEVLPPDVNRSTHRFTIADDKHLLAPFSSVKGISENSSKRIVELQERNRGWKVVKQKKKRDGTIEAVYGLDEIRHARAASIRLKNSCWQLHSQARRSTPRWSRICGWLVRLPNLRREADLL